MPHTSASATLPPSTFLLKLARLLNNHANSDVVGWDMCGNQFTVKCVARMEQAVLRHYFRNALSYTAFRQQLLAYGFVLMGHHVDTDTFRHPHYTRRTSAITKPRRGHTPLVVPDHIEPPCTSSSRELACNPNWGNMTTTTTTGPENPLFQQQVDRNASWSVLLEPAIVCV
ncbi:Aste57867_1659 [Aphanomyces stellatus]|uniref:Aste57867_1659 protein n=1 Tax=Aphanomyces stellatus TaxID=120398 RepID=A0A485K6Y9_9STRA|nr:hypothetical protein As57867_001657 [Aphanomyces stellatus]VFT78871.1 Aste57867_1659 [Aphanomyces stellatus]